jgi:hypothetical protein
MDKEMLQFNRELKQLATSLGATFIQRWDIHARQREDGSYVCVYQPLQEHHLQAHLQGEVTLGAYVLDRNSNARYIVFDADTEAQRGQLEAMARSLSAEGVPSYLENSRRGGHLWFFFGPPVEGKAARAFARGLAEIYALADMEVFPKQDQLSGGPGSLIRLPFGVHQKSGQRYGFICPDGAQLAPTIPEQIQALSPPLVVPGEMFDFYRAVGQHHPERVDLRLKKASGETLSQQIKSRVSVGDFIGQYIELDTSGRGLCPFHDDHQASFSVNTEKNYWHCFAGCGGGSIIDFWMQWQECDFKTAVSELARMLLT